VELIRQWLKEDKHRPTKQRHPAKRIYERLKGEYGDRTVRREVQIGYSQAPLHGGAGLGFFLGGLREKKLVQKKWYAKNLRKLYYKTRTMLKCWVIRPKGRIFGGF
jgi:hypothetical protein